MSDSNADFEELVRAKRRSRIGAGDREPAVGLRNRIYENFGIGQTLICLLPLHDYDATLKKILTRSGSLLLRTLTASDSVKWLNVELHRRGSLRADLLGRTTDGRLIHIELQSRNEKAFHFRMGEYGFAAAREHAHYPEQVVLFVGQEPLRMKSESSCHCFRSAFMSSMSGIWKPNNCWRARIRATI